jgi:hypothetical protein
MKINNLFARTYFFVLAFSCSFWGEISAQNNNWDIRATDVNAEYIGAPVANGGIGILPWKEPFSIRHVVLNHVFDADEPQGISKVLYGINPFVLEMKVNGETVSLQNISKWQQTINLKEAAHSTQFIVNNEVIVNYSIFALRNMPYSGLIKIDLEALNDVDLQFTNSITEDYRYPCFRGLFPLFRALHRNFSELSPINFIGNFYPSVCN